MILSNIYHGTFMRIYLASSSHKLISKKKLHYRLLTRILNTLLNIKWNQFLDIFIKHIQSSISRVPQIKIRFRNETSSLLQIFINFGHRTSIEKKMKRL